MTVAQLCDHFEQRELAKENSWHSHATKKIYKAHLTHWIRPHWKKYQLAEVRTIQVEWFLQASAIGAEDRTEDRRSCANIYARRHNEPEFRSDSDGIRSGTPT